MKKTMILTVLALLLVLIISACGSASKIERGPDFTRGSKYWPQGKICASAGEPATQETINQDLDFATQQARVELARQMGAVVNAIFKDYTRKMTAKSESYDESVTVNDSTLQVFNQVVVGAKIYDSDTTATHVWVLVCIEQENFYNSIEKSDSLSDELKEEVTSRAQKEWDKLIESDSK